MQCVQLLGDSILQSSEVLLRLLSSLQLQGQLTEALWLHLLLTTQLLIVRNKLLVGERQLLRGAATDRVKCDHIIYCGTHSGAGTVYSKVHRTALELQPLTHASSLRDITSIKCLRINYRNNHCKAHCITTALSWSAIQHLRSVQEGTGKTERKVKVLLYSVLMAAQERLRERWRCWYTVSSWPCLHYEYTEPSIGCRSTE